MNRLTLSEDDSFMILGCVAGENEYMGTLCKKKYETKVISKLVDDINNNTIGSYSVEVSYFHVKIVMIEPKEYQIQLINVLSKCAGISIFDNGYDIHIRIASITGDNFSSTFPVGDCDRFLREIFTDISVGIYKRYIVRIIDRQWAVLTVFYDRYDEKVVREFVVRYSYNNDGDCCVIL